MKSDKGFSLVELMITCAFMAIILSAAVSMGTKVIEKVDETKVKTSVAKVKRILEDIDIKVNVSTESKTEKKKQDWGSVTTSSDVN